MIENYFPILIVLILVSGFAFVSLILSHFIGPKIPNTVKMMPYESGVDPVGETRIRFSIRFFLIALLFIIFGLFILLGSAIAAFFTMLGSEIIRLLLDFHDNNHINTKIRVKTLEALETISDKLKK